MLMPGSKAGVVMMKIISSTNAKSSKGVTLISLSVTSELRWEKRRMIIRKSGSLRIGPE